MAVAAIPAWIYYVALAASVASSVASGVISSNQASYQKDVAEQNDIAAKHEASSISEVEARKGQQDVGHARALAAASGLTVDGSAAGVMGALAAQGEFNARSALYQGRRRSDQFQADALNAGQAGKAAVIGTIASTGTVLTSGLRANSSAGPATRSGGTSDFSGGDFDAGYRTK